MGMVSRVEEADSAALVMLAVALPLLLALLSAVLDSAVLDSVVLEASADVDAGVDDDGSAETGPSTNVARMRISSHCAPIDSS